MAGLYPIAGAGAAAGAGLLYLLARVTGGGYDRVHEWAWFGCFLGLVALFRLETRIEAAHPRYVTLRRRLRLALSFFGFCYLGADEGNPLGVTLITAAVGTVVVHFLLRSNMLRLVWHGVQHVSGVRKDEAPVKPTDAAI